MRVEDLQGEELLELLPGDGIIRFAGHRALLLDAVAMGLLRHYIAENFGLTAARAVLTQFGFAHGWRMAAALRHDLPWASDDEWRRAGPHLCGLQGLLLPHPVGRFSEGPLLQAKGGSTFTSRRFVSEETTFSRWPAYCSQNQPAGWVARSRALPQEPADPLLRHEWPGNVRELENAMERAVALARGRRVDVEDLYEEVRLASPKPLLREGPIQPLKAIEREYTLAALRLNDGNQARTARPLEISQATLYRRLKSDRWARTGDA